MMKSSNLGGLSSIHSPLSSFILNASFSILVPQTSFIQPHFSIFISSSSILSQKNGILDSKSPQNCVISDNMSASAACTACSFFQVWWAMRCDMTLVQIWLSLYPILGWTSTTNPASLVNSAPCQGPYSMSYFSNYFELS